MTDLHIQPFSSARKFLEALRLSDKNWSDDPKKPQDWEREWIFRGEGQGPDDSDWSPLMPTAWRRDVNNQPPKPLSKLIGEVENNATFKELMHPDMWQWWFSEHSMFTEGVRTATFERIRAAVRDAYAELTLVNEFTRLADELGFGIETLPDWTRRIDTFIENYMNLYVPDNSLRQRNESERLRIGSDKLNMRYAFWESPAIALARHHGIPTRLLDWSRNPMAAAYFAAAQAEGRTTGRLTVYAVHTSLSGVDLKTVEVSATENDFLRAQHGLFTVNPIAHIKYVYGGGVYTGVRQDLLYQARSTQVSKPFRAFTLPVGKAAELLRYLWLERVTPAHLMPTLDHVGEAVNLKVRLTGNTLGIIEKTK